MYLHASQGIYNVAMSKSRLPAFIRDARLRAGLTQEDLASRTGLSGSYISQLENDRVDMPTPRTREKLARALSDGDQQVTPEDIKRAAVTTTDSRPDTLALLERIGALQSDEELAQAWLALSPSARAAVLRLAAYLFRQAATQLPEPSTVLEECATK